MKFKAVCKGVYDQRPSKAVGRISRGVIRSHERAILMILLGRCPGLGGEIGAARTGRLAPLQTAIGGPHETAIRSKTWDFETAASRLGKHLPNPVAHYLLLCDLLIASDVRVYVDQHGQQPIDPALAATAKTDFLNEGQLTPIEINAIGFLNTELENRSSPARPVRLILLARKSA